MPDHRPAVQKQLARLLNRAQSRGTGEVAELAADRLKEAWNSRNTLILNVLRAEAVQRSVPGLTFREASAADGEAYARDIGTDSAATFSARLGPDVRCFVVEEDGRLLHASWVTTSAAWAREVGRYLGPPSGDAYVYESFTRSDARGRGIYPLALAGILTALASEGIKDVWVGVEASNLASRRAMEKAGFSEGFRVEFGRRLGKLWVGAPVGPKAEVGRSFMDASSRTGVPPTP
jgi:RimJ/RimL family protein N-acetyltransferase